MPSYPIRRQGQHIRQVAVDALHHHLHPVQRLDACPVRVRRPVGTGLWHHLWEDMAGWVRGLRVPSGGRGDREDSRCL